jgi:hypothetical protein
MFSPSLSVVTVAEEPVIVNVFSEFPVAPIKLTFMLVVEQREVSILETTTSSTLNVSAV